MFALEVLKERQEFWQHLRCFPASLLPKHTRSEGLPNLFRRQPRQQCKKGRCCARAGPMFTSVEFFGCAYPCRYSCSAGFAAFLQGLLLNARCQPPTKARRAIHQEGLCELFGQPPHPASPKIIAAARRIAEALKSLPIDDPRAVRIFQGTR
jgi:hypothetical protein